MSATVAPRTVPAAAIGVGFAPAEQLCPRAGHDGLLNLDRTRPVVAFDGSLRAGSTLSVGVALGAEPTGRGTVATPAASTSVALAVGAVGALAELLSTRIESVRWRAALHLRCQCIARAVERRRELHQLPVQVHLSAATIQRGRHMHDTARAHVLAQALQLSWAQRRPHDDEKQMTRSHVVRAERADNFGVLAARTPDSVIASARIVVVFVRLPVEQYEAVQEGPYLANAASKAKSTRAAVKSTCTR